MRLTLDPAIAHPTPDATVYIADGDDCTFPLYGVDGIRHTYRLDRVVTHGDGTWTAHLVKQTSRGRDFTSHAARRSLRNDDLAARAPLQLHDAIAVALDVAEETAGTGGVPFDPGTGPIPGYMAGRCGHRVAESEWRAGFRTCERCPDVAEEAVVRQPTATGCGCVEFLLARAAMLRSGEWIGDSRALARAWALEGAAHDLAEPDCEDVTVTHLDQWAAAHRPPAEVTS